MTTDHESRSHYIISYMWHLYRKFPSWSKCTSKPASCQLALAVNLAAI